ncbi:MAG TPA: diaminopimelate epimerase [Pyrinomonadaceae bacterium]|nr:diaminopimelate epimerase [Pyrinomonadaceae bacterium]
MKKINFCKFHGFGNDYIVFEAESLSEIEDKSDFAIKVCNRHTGIGGDGIAVLKRLGNGEADYYCEIINPDGSVAGFSGNGTRCAVAYLYYKNLFSGENLKLETKSGMKNYQFIKREENTFWYLAELGKPNFDLPDSDFLRSLPPPENESEHSLPILFNKEGIVVNVFYVDVGNPVACIFVENFDDTIVNSQKFGWRYFGRKIESLTEIFPQRTNVVFIKTKDRNNIEIRIWERGAGETSSSGTCSIAAAVASIFTGKTDRKVSVHAEGGTTEAVWREDGEMMITGRADLAFCGEVFI